MLLTRLRVQFSRAIRGLPIAKKKGKLGGGFLSPDDRRLTFRALRMHVTRYAFASQFVKDKVTLDVACGPGYGSAYLLHKGASKVVGGEISDEAIKYAEEHYKRDGTEFIRLDAARLPFPDDSFDTIVSMETIEHLGEYERFLYECQRVLRDGGTFICSTPNKEFLSPGMKKTSAPVHVREFYIDDFCSLLRSYFPDTRLYGLDFIASRVRAEVGGTLRLAIAKLTWVPLIWRLMNLITRFTLQDMRPARLGDVKELDEMLDKNYYPVPIDDNPLPPYEIIAVAKASKAS